MEEVIIEAVKTQGFATLALVTGIIALWKTLQAAHGSRITALESAVDKCMDKHDDCERRNRELAAAMIDVIEDRDPLAKARCKEILRKTA